MKRLSIPAAIVAALLLGLVAVQPGPSRSTTEAAVTPSATGPADPRSWLVITAAPPSPVPPDKLPPQPSPLPPTQTPVITGPARAIPTDAPIMHWAPDRGTPPSPW